CRPSRLPTGRPPAATGFAATEDEVPHDKAPRRAEEHPVMSVRTSVHDANTPRPPPRGIARSRHRLAAEPSPVVAGSARRRGNGLLYDGEHLVEQPVEGFIVALDLHPVHVSSEEPGSLPLEEVVRLEADQPQHA